MDPINLRRVGEEALKERPRYTLEQLLSESEFPESHSPEDREWVDAPRVGREPI